jgi:D-alanine-D-alanine ligase-like ATP-grasp enzyme
MDVPLWYISPMTEFHELKEKPGDCVDCGNSPVNHRVTHFFNTGNVWGGIFLKKLSQNFLYRKINQGLSYLHFYLAKYHHGFSYLLGIIRYKNDSTKAVSYRSQVIWEDGNALGIATEQVSIYGRGTELYRSHLPEGFLYAKSPKRTIYYESLPIPPWETSVGNQWFDDKYLLKKVLRESGIPAPESVSVITEDEAVAAFTKIGAPVVCKPRIGSRARHTTVFITSEPELRAAFRSAKKLCRYVCIEKHLVGPVCRATVVGGKLVGFFEAFTARVTGDGTSTIAELIAHKNSTKHERVKEVVINDEHIRFLAKHNLTLDSVLPNGKTIPITWRTGRLFGGETRELLSTVHPQLREQLERAAYVLDTAIVGFDVIMPNPEQHPDEQQWGIIEANSMPYIDIHYLPLSGEPSRVANAVWDLWRRNTKV